MAFLIERIDETLRYLITPKQHQLRMFQPNEDDRAIFDSDPIVQVFAAFGAREGQFYLLN